MGKHREDSARRARPEAVRTGQTIHMEYSFETWGSGGLDLDYTDINHICPSIQRPLWAKQAAGTVLPRRHGSVAT